MTAFMKHTRLCLGVFVAVAIHAGPAQAQASRTWVSGVGDDANPCSRTAPCKTFAGAISKTASKGVISVLDPGGFGAVTITKSISIIANFPHGSILAAGTNGVVVNAASTDRVVLDGLDIDGIGTGLNGISIVGGGSVVVRRTSIRNFTGNGVNLAGTSGARLLVQDSNISFNGGGVQVAGASGVSNNAIIDRSIIDTHTSFGVQVSAGGAAYISASQIIGGSSPKLSMSGGGTVTSYGNNIIRGATSAPTTTLPLQ